MNNHEQYKNGWPEWAAKYLVEASDLKPGAWFLTVSFQPLRRIRWQNGDRSSGVIECRDVNEVGDCIRGSAKVLPLLFEDSLPGCTKKQYDGAFQYRVIVQGVAMFPMCDGIASALRDEAKSVYANLPPGCEPEDFEDEDLDDEAAK